MSLLSSASIELSLVLIVSLSKVASKSLLALLILELRLLVLLILELILEVKSSLACGLLLSRALLLLASVEVVEFLSSLL